jgi:hypothetical protein
MPVLIENNNKGIVRFWLNEIQINEEIIEKIHKNYNLKEFSFCCQTLQSKKDFKNGQISKKIRCQISYDRIDLSISFLKVQTLRLVACLLPKLMDCIAKLFNITTTLCNRLSL